MANTPYQTTDAMQQVQGTQNATLGFYGATGVAGPASVTGATAGTDPVAASLRAALVALNLIK